MHTVTNAPAVDVAAAAQLGAQHRDPLLASLPLAVPELSIFDPVYLGIDEAGLPVTVRLIYRNMLIAGEPGGGKSSLLNIIAAHAALSMNCRLVLFDGKQGELGQWEACADVFVGP